MKCVHQHFQRIHIQKDVKTHRGNKPYFCKVCGLSFFQESFLKIHMWTYTREKPFPFKVCSSEFLQRSILKAKTNNI